MRTIVLSQLAAAALGLDPAYLAANPIVQTIYTADPAPVVHNGTLYLFSSHDEDELVKNFFTMKDWRCFSTTDMVNWTDHGAVASLRSFKWADPKISGWGGFENGAWAPQAIHRDGKWYLYVPLQGRGIGVLVADSPLGPYTDPIGAPLIKNDNIDPTVFIDDDGQAYLCWGNPKCWYVKLNKDMISYDKSVGDQSLVVYDMTVQQFGERSKPDEKRPTSYEEGPWLYKREGLYYLFFAGGPISEHLAYSTGKSPVGPWEYRGIVMPTQGGSFTNHPGVVDFKGKTYLFYHNAALPGGGGFHRSVCVDEMMFNPDGTVVKMDMTKEGPAPVASLNPYKRVEGETIAWCEGIKAGPIETGGIAVWPARDTAFVRVRNVDFGPKGATRFGGCFAAENEGATLEIHLDRADGPLAGSLALKPSAGKWITAKTGITRTTGTHDVYFVFKGAPDKSKAKLDWWQLAP